MAAVRFTRLRLKDKCRLDANANSKRAVNKWTLLGRSDLLPLRGVFFRGRKKRAASTLEYYFFYFFLHLPASDPGAIWRTRRRVFSEGISCIFKGTIRGRSSQWPLVESVPHDLHTGKAAGSYTDDMSCTNVFDTKADLEKTGVTYTKISICFSLICKCD